MILAVDIGNTRIKAAVFEHTTLLKAFVFHDGALVKNILSVQTEFTNLNHIVVSSVGPDVTLQLNQLPQNIRISTIDRGLLFPFKNDYETPNTLGIDRMILASGAVLQYPNQNRLVIDAGTCITYDFVDATDKYLGGAISPGIRLRYEAMHNFTARLPLLRMEAPQHFIGKSTSESMHSGVINGVVNEIDGFINCYRSDYPNFIIILTGGNGEFLANRLKNTIFANSNFLLESLNQTFLYQSNK